MLTPSIHKEQNLPLGLFQLVAKALDRWSWKHRRRCRCRFRFHRNHRNRSRSHFHYPRGSSWTKIGSSQGLDRWIHRSQVMRRRGWRPRHRQLEIPRMGSIVFAGGGEALFIFVVNEMTILLLTIDVVRVEGRHCSLSLSLSLSKKTSKKCYWVEGRHYALKEDITGFFFLFVFFF